MNDLFKQGRDLEDLTEELSRVIGDHVCGHNVHHRADVSQIANEIAALATRIADDFDRAMLALEKSGHAT